MTYEIRLRHLPDVWLQEDTIEKAREQRGEVCPKQSPSGVAGLKGLKRLKVHWDDI